MEPQLLARLDLIGRVFALAIRCAMGNIDICLNKKRKTIESTNNTKQTASILFYFNNLMLVSVSA